VQEPERLYFLLPLLFLFLLQTFDCALYLLNRRMRSLQFSFPLFLLCNQQSDFSINWWLRLYNFNPWPPWRYPRPIPPYPPFPRLLPITKNKIDELASKINKIDGKIGLLLTLLMERKLIISNDIKKL
jgi:hypothetical protein